MTFNAIRENKILAKITEFTEEAFLYGFQCQDQPRITILTNCQVKTPCPL